VILMMMAALPFAIALVVAHRVQSSRAVWRALEEQGFLVRRMELRFFTRGPFREMLCLPGLKHSDTLFRVLAEDRSGTSHVLWARIPVGMPWDAPRCETRRDEAPDRTSRGIGALAYYTFVAGLTAAMVALIIFLSGAPLFAAVSPQSSMFHTMRPSTELSTTVRVASERRNPLVGLWRQSGWTFCTPVSQLSAEQMDPPIEELWFKGDGTFTVTWFPFESYKDYWGHYSYDQSSGRIELVIEHGNYVPPDFVSKGTVRVDGQQLTLEGVRLGTKRAKNGPAICQLRFTRV
jgi:hypothetical protein